VIPIGDPALEKVELNVTAANEELGNGDTAERSVRFRPSVTRVLRNWQRVMFVDFLQSDSRTGTERTSGTLVAPGISFAPVPRGFSADNALDATSGFYVELIGSHRSLSSRANFLRFRARNDWRWRLAPKWSLLARAEIGATAVKNFDELPPQYRFFAGGDRSVRGFGFNTLSPRESQVVRDESGQPRIDPLTGEVETQSVRTGGRHLVVGSLEIERDLPRNFAVAVFADVGNAFNTFGDPLEYSAGVGVRYKLPFVSVGLDVAQALSESTGPRVHLNITPVY
jgi:translocation and assembly module TamA